MSTTAPAPAVPLREQLRARILIGAAIALSALPLAAGAFAALTAASPADDRDYPAFTAFVAAAVAWVGYSLLLAAHLAVALFVRALRERHLMPNGLAIPLAATFGGGLLLLDLGITGLWPAALGASAFVLGIAIGGSSIAAMGWLGYQLARVVFQPHVSHRFRKHRMAMASLLLLLLLASTALAYPLIDSAESAIKPVAGLRYAGADEAPPFGADHLGRNVLLRLIRGAQVSLAVGLISSITSAVVETYIMR